MKTEKLKQFRTKLCSDKSRIFICLLVEENLLGDYLLILR